MQLHRTSPGASPKSTSHAHPLLRFLTHYYVELLTVFAVLFVLQTGLVPFDLDHTPDTGETTRLFGVTVTHLTVPDVISNIFLYVPLGALVYLSLSRLNKNGLLLWPMAVILVFMLSFAIEWLQSYSVRRVSSLIDLASNLVGACLGATLACFVRRLVPRFVSAAVTEWRLRPQAIILKGYIASIIIVAAVPFSLSFDVARLKQSIKTSVLVPFGGSQTVAVPSTSEIGDASVHAFARYRWAEMKRWSRWAAETVSFGLLAWLMHVVLNGDYRFARRSTTYLIWWFGASLAVALSLLQLPIISRTFDVTDILFRCFGLWAGLLTRSAYLRKREFVTKDVIAKREQVLARVATFGVLTYIVYAGLIPMKFSLEPGAPTQAFLSDGFLPFFAYFMARFDLMMDDVMEKFLSYALFAALLVTGWNGLRAQDSRLQWLIPTTLGVGVSVLIETAQIFIPVRTTSMTDPILAVAGCTVGVVAHRFAVAVFHSTEVTDRTAPLQQAEDIPLRRLSTVDSLMATLADPHPDAPTEQVPQAPARTPQHQP